MHILLTRPLEDSAEMILKFQSLGHKISHIPLLSVNEIKYESINFSNFKHLRLQTLINLNFLTHLALAACAVRLVDVGLT